MRRGPKISQGMELALPFALRRGHVMVFMAALMNIAEFLITGNGLFVLVRVRLARRIRAGIADVEHEFADAIAGLRLVPRSGPVSCELWLYSRHGTLRHFRVENTRLVETDSCGTPLDRAYAMGKPLPAIDQSGAVPMSAARETAKGPAASVPDPGNPIYRWLKRWNAARIAGGSAGSAGSGRLKKILDSGKPGAPAGQITREKIRRKKGTAAGADPPGICPEAEDPSVGKIPSSLPSVGSPMEGSMSDGKPGIL